MEEFAKYYDMPLMVDDYCGYYIWAKHTESGTYSMMAFNYLETNKVDNGDLKEIYDIVNTINGYSPGYYDASINPENPEIIQIKGVDKLIVRGWGDLTSPGGFNLSYEEAIKVQNDFVKWTVKQLRRNI